MTHWSTLCECAEVCRVTTCPTCQKNVPGHHFCLRALELVHVQESKVSFVIGSLVLLTMDKRFDSWCSFFVTLGVAPQVCA